MRHRNRLYKQILVLIMFIVSLAMFEQKVYASSTSMKISGCDYEDSAPILNIDNSSVRDSFSYGKKSLGNMSLHGDIAQNGKYNGTEAFSVNDNVTLKYSYDGAFSGNKKPGEWGIYNEDKNNIAGIVIDKSIKSGSVVLQKSYDGNKWEKADVVYYDSFKKANDLEIYTTSSSEIRRGTYYRITVVYTLQREVGKEGGIHTAGHDLFQSSVIEYKHFVEQYTFYVCTDKNYVVLRDLFSKNVINNKDYVRDGFFIDSQGSFDAIAVTYDGATIDAKDKDIFKLPGKYKVLITTKLGKKYSYEINIITGMSTIDILPNVYESDDEGVLQPIIGNSTSGISSLTSLKIGQSSTDNIYISEKDEFDAYGISGGAAKVIIRLNYGPELLGDEWRVVYDKWGKKEYEVVEDMQLGELGVGTVIIQTSKTGKDGSWFNLEDGKYAAGLYNTDFATHYKANEDILLYTPSTKDLNDGIYIRVIYLYLLENQKTHKREDCSEEYEFYLCNNMLGAVSFENLSVNKSGLSKYGDFNENEIQYIMQTQTLPTNSVTFKGFKINTEKNPSIKVSVKKDGRDFSIPDDGKIKETGKYDIHLESNIGNKGDVSIYVDTSSDKNVMKYYFGDGFVRGKRVYDPTSSIPVYEAGNSYYVINQVSDSRIPISGEIKNTDTGETINISATRGVKRGDFTKPGTYIAVFRTGFTQNESAGDYRTFTFNFKIIENGTAPGPVVNQNELYNVFAEVNFCDVYPVYYSVSFMGAKQTPVNTAFSNEEEAKQYAISIIEENKEDLSKEKGQGFYRYNALGESFVFGPDDEFEKTEKLYELSNRIVKKSYFDMSNIDTYVTLSKKIVDENANLLKLELRRKVTVLGKEPNDQKEMLLCTTQYPVITKKPYSVINIAHYAINPDTGTTDFVFKKDKYGADSYIVYAMNDQGERAYIKYNIGVTEQLDALNWPSGVVTFTESTLYGDKSEYKAYYLKTGENQAVLTMNLVQDGKNVKKEFSQDDDKQENVADSFSVKAFDGGIDEHSLIIITKDNKEEVSFFAGDDIDSTVWSEPGQYIVKVVNRYGSAYSFNINIPSTQETIDE